MRYSVALVPFIWMCLTLYVVLFASFEVLVKSRRHVNGLTVKQKCQVIVTSSTFQLMRNRLPTLTTS